MLYIKSLTVKSYDYQSATLEWEYTDPAANTAGVHLEIYRSETPAPVTMFSGIALNVSPTAHSYVDTSISGLNLYQFHTWYYRIKVVDDNNPNIFEWSYPAYLSIDPDLQAKKMLRLKTIGLKRYGVKVKILKKRIAQGETCDCFDEILGRSTDDECPYCHGTGIKTTGGYYDPIEVYGAINTRPKQNQITPFGIWQDNNALLDILNYPVLEPDDVVIDQLNNRYKVKQVAPYMKGQALISQRCLLVLQDKSDPIYEIKV